MGFLVFLRKSRFFMQSRFRLDFRAQRGPKNRFCTYAPPPKIDQFLMIFQHFFDCFLKGFLGRSGRILGSRGDAKNIQKH